MTIASLRRCLTALVVALSIGVGPGVAQALAEVGDHHDRSYDGHGQDEKRSDESPDSCKGHEDHDDEGHKDDRGRGEGCRDEEHDEAPADESAEEESHDDDGGSENAHEGEARKRGRYGDREYDSADNGDRSDGSVRAQQAAPTPTPSGSPNEPNGVSLEVTVTASRAVARVGDEIDYTVTVTNTGEAELADVTVVDLVPPELDVVSVPLAEGVEAAQAGLSPRGEDVVWILGPLPARATVEVSWKGVVSQSGDLEATNIVTATSDNADARASATTFLATATAVAARRTAPEVMPKRIVTTTRVPVTAAGPGAPLPATALGIEWLLALALAIFFVGIALLILGRPPLMVGRGSAYALALLAIVYAATFIGDPSTISEPQPRPSETVVDEVKGKRIFNNEARPTPTPEPQDPANDDAGSIAAPAEEPPDAVEFRTVRTVRTVKVPVEAASLPSTPGTNAVAFSWDEPSRRILQATSSLGPITEAPSVELLTSVDMSGDALEATLVLRNIGDDLISVRGVLSYEITGEGVALSLGTRRIDVILRPRGEVQATFRYLLPSGDYQAGAKFVAD